MHHIPATRTTPRQRRRAPIALLWGLLAVLLGSASVAAASPGASQGATGSGPSSGIAACYLLTSADEIDACFRGAGDAAATATLLTQGAIGERIDIRARRDSTVTMQKVTIPAGSSTGWHSHEAEALAVVATGTVTLLDDDCQERTVAAGQGFTENPGHVHLARNDGTVTVEVYVTYVSRPGAPLRVDQPAPRGCPVS